MTRINALDPRTGPVPHMHGCPDCGEVCGCAGRTCDAPYQRRCARCTQPISPPPAEPAPDLIAICGNGEAKVIVSRAQLEETARAVRQRPAVCLSCSFAAPHHAQGCRSADKPRCPDCGHYWCAGCASLWPQEPSAALEPTPPLETQAEDPDRCEHCGQITVGELGRTCADIPSWRRWDETMVTYCHPPKDTCPHPPARLYSWMAYDGALCVACCDCGTPLAGALPAIAGGSEAETMAAHTPGPWSIAPVLDPDADLPIIWERASGRGIAQMLSANPADAALLAAAPALLAACQHAATVLKRSGLGERTDGLWDSADDLLGILRQAIAQATQR